jgi:hypothetical protein
MFMPLCANRGVVIISAEVIDAIAAAVWLCVSAGVQSRRVGSSSKPSASPNEVDGWRDVVCCLVSETALVKYHASNSVRSRPCIRHRSDDPKSACGFEDSAGDVPPSAGDYIGESARIKAVCNHGRLAAASQLAARFSQVSRALQKILPADRLRFGECRLFSWPRFARDQAALRAPLRAPPTRRLPNRIWAAGGSFPQPSRFEATAAGSRLSVRSSTMEPETRRESMIRFFRKDHA